MKTTHPRHKRQKVSPKVLILSGAAVVLIIALAFTYVYAFKGNLFGWQPTKETSVPQTDQGIKEDQVTDDTTPSGSNLPSKNGENSTVDTDAETPATAPEKPSLQRAGGDPTITVVATFQQASAGYCELQLSKAGHETLSYKSEIVVGTAYYTCSFKVAKSSLPSAESWNAVVIHHIGTAKTSSDLWKVS